MDDEVEIVEEPADMGVVVLMLSLYLIMLAFFILLNAISEDNPNKVDEVKESVSEQFSLKTEGDKTFDDNTMHQDTPTYDYISKEVEGLIEAFLSLDEVDFKTEANNLHVMFPASMFFETGEVRLKPEAGPFLDHLAELLMHLRYGIRIDTRITVYAAENQQDEAVDELAGRQSTLLIRALIDRGVLPILLTSAAAASKGKSFVEMQFEMDILDDSKAQELMRSLQSAAAVAAM